MHGRALSISGAWEFEPSVFPDDRGQFIAPYQESVFTAVVGHPLHVAQTNLSATKRGAIRGVHFADVPLGQAKYVYAASGSLLDVVVDIRVGSPTFGQWEQVTLDATRGNAVYISEGLGHAVLSLSDDAAVAYLCSTGYNPSAEHGLTPLDPELGLPWPQDSELVVSAKDREAPTLAQALADGILPSYQG